MDRTGSTGYGKGYQRLIHRDWGGGDLKDLEACALYLRSLPWVDPDRIAIFGVSNLVTFTRSVPPTCAARSRP